MLAREPDPPASRPPATRPPVEQVAEDLSFRTSVVVDALAACARGNPEEAERMVSDDPTSSWPPGG